MKVILLDTQLGMLAVDALGDAYWWMHGNGSCDCNRGYAFGIHSERGICLGCHRFLVVSCDDPTYTLRELNAGYPERLLAEFCEGQYADARPDALPEGAAK